MVFKLLLENEITTWLMSYHPDKERLKRFNFDSSSIAWGYRCISELISLQAGLCIVF